MQKEGYISNTTYEIPSRVQAIANILYTSGKAQSILSSLGELMKFIRNEGNDRL